MKDARRQTPDAKGLRSGERVRHPKQSGWSRHLGHFGLLSEAASQACEHPLYVFQLSNHRRNTVFVSHAQENRDQQMRFQFRGRTQRDVDKPGELSISEATASFGDVRCDRDRCPATLRDETKTFRPGECLSDAVDAADNDTTSLPDLELPKILHPPLVSGKRSRWNALASSNASGFWRLASVVPPQFAIANDTPQRSGVWRLASGVSSSDPTASLS